MKTLKTRWTWLTGASTIDLAHGHIGSIAQPFGQQAPVGVTIVVIEEHRRPAELPHAASHVAESNRHHPGQAAQHAQDR